MSGTGSRWVSVLVWVGVTFVSAAVASAQTVQVVGTVRDGSGHGWPLYATVAVSADGFPGATATSDPATGYYSVELPPGATYQFAVTSLVPGYSPGGGELTLPPAAGSPPAATVASWRLAAAPSCLAPGFGPGGFAGPLVLSESFDAGVIPPGWSFETLSGVSWKVAEGADPCFQFEGNETGGTGPYAIVNSGCESQLTPDDTFLYTPSMDLTGRTTAAIQWANDFIDNDAGSVANVDVSTDLGATWTNVWHAEGNVPGPGLQIADLSIAAGQPSVVVRFHYQGFYAWWWQVDDVKVGTFACSPIPGGLLVGAVRDANNGGGLNGATVQIAAGGASTQSFTTPDLAGFYNLFVEDGGFTNVEASYPNYETGTGSAIVVPDGTTRFDFALKSGLLEFSPRPLQAFVAPGTTQDKTLTITNIGTAAGLFRIQEVGVPPVSAVNPVSAATPERRRQALAQAPELTLGNAGDVVSSFPTNLDYGFGLVYDTDASRLWIANPYFPDFGILGDGLEHQFLPDGTDTGESIDIHDTGGFQQADGTYNARTGMLWQVNLGGDRCLFEMDPVTKVVTGNRICGTPETWGADTSQRGMAYDYATDTYYVGGFNSTLIYHVDGAGNLLDSADVGLSVAGLAYNPTTRHLFVLNPGSAPWDVWVIEPQADYAAIGGFRVTEGGAPALQSDALSLEADCSGRLWVNSADTHIVRSFESGETGWCVNDIPWLSEDPTEGAVASSASQPVTVRFDTHNLLPGLRQGSLIFSTDTPQTIAPVPVDFTVLFNDVAEGDFASNFIYGAAGAGVMPGCAPQAPISNFCRNEIVTRRSMASYIERAIHGASTPPPVYLGEFEDVRPESVNANYIQGLVDDRVTAGCNVAPPLYCPDEPVTRAQMAVFVWRALKGDEAPPSCAGIFDDVPCPGGFAVDYIEGIAALDITAGCSVAPSLYCPDAGITNAQMAVYLVKAFGLAYLP